MPDWQQIRADFPSLRDWTYLNSATFGQVPRRAVAAMNRHMDQRDEFACTDFLGWFDDMDALRGKVAQLIHCEPDDIAFVQNASTALSLLMGGIGLMPGDRVVTLEHEFPNHYYYAQSVPGVEFVETTWDQLHDAITPATRLVAISEVNYATGFRTPVDELASFLRERGVLFYVDGTQSLGALACDLRGTRPDMYAVNAYKWMLSPSGAGFMYVSPELRKRLAPSVIGWRSHWDWRNHDNLHQGVPEFKSSAEKYEGGMMPFPVLYAMEAVIDLMLQIGPAVIERRVLGLADGVREVLRAAGAAIVSKDSQIVTARFDGIDPSDLARGLKERRVLVAARLGNLRVSPHFYNDESDLDRLADALRYFQGS